MDFGSTSDYPVGKNVDFHRRALCVLRGASLSSPRVLPVLRGDLVLLALSRCRTGAWGYS